MNFVKVASVVLAGSARSANTSSLSCFLALLNTPPTRVLACTPAGFGPVTAMYQQMLWLALSGMTTTSSLRCRCHLMQSPVTQPHTASAVKHQETIGDRLSVYTALGTCRHMRVHTVSMLFWSFALNPLCCRMRCLRSPEIPGSPPPGPGVTTWCRSFTTSSSSSATSIWCPATGMSCRRCPSPSSSWMPVWAKEENVAAKGFVCVRSLFGRLHTK